MATPALIPHLRHGARRCFIYRLYNRRHAQASQTQYFGKKYIGNCERTRGSFAAQVCGSVNCPALPSVDRHSQDRPPPRNRLRACRFRNTHSRTGPRPESRPPFSRPAPRFRRTSPSAAFTLPVCHCPQWGIVVLWSRSNRILTRASLPGRAAGSIMVQSRRNAGICLHRTGWPSRWGRLP